MKPTVFIDLKPRLDDPEVRRVRSLSLLQPASPKAVDRVLGVVEYYIRDENAVYIAGIAITEECRGQGIGHAMVMALREKYGLPLEAEADSDAIGFYQKCGFVVKPFEQHGARRWKCRL